MTFKTILDFNRSQCEEDKKICEKLRQEIDRHLPEAVSKVWHGHPVWFLDGNPTVGYSRLKDCIRLMFWSGADFEEEKLETGTGKFKDASARYTNVEQVNLVELKRWCGKAKAIQWDYRNIQKRKGKLIRIGETS